MSNTFTSHPPVIGDSQTIRNQRLLDAGYTIIYITHSGAPKHSIPEILGDTHRAVRFVRHNAKWLDVDPDRIAIMGGSSGGYLDPNVPLQQSQRMLDALHNTGAAAEWVANFRLNTLSRGSLARSGALCA